MHFWANPFAIVIIASALRFQIFREEGTRCTRKNGRELERESEAERMRERICGVNGYWQNNEQRHNTSRAVVSLPLKRTIYFRSIIIIPYMQNLNGSLYASLVNAALVQPFHSVEIFPSLFLSLDASLVHTFPLFSTLSWSSLADAACPYLNLNNNI